MSKKRIKQYLMLLTVVGLVSIASGSGTFASFTAETTNPGNTFATGTIVLSNTVGAGSACLSTNGGTTDTNINATCDQVFNATVKKPGDSAVSSLLDIKNVGSINASTFTLTSGLCSAANAVGETYHGSNTAGFCGLVDVYVQETDNTGAPTHCWYGGGTATTCAFDDTKTLSTLHTAGAITGGTPGLTANTDRYFKIGVELQSGAGNNVQGLASSNGLTWDIAQ